MTTGQHLKGVLVALADKIDLDRVACERLVREIRTYIDVVDPGRPVNALVALDIERYYSSLESTFETIARDIDGAVPEGKDWHQHYGAEMQAVPRCFPRIHSLYESEKGSRLGCVEREF